MTGHSDHGLSSAEIRARQGHPTIDCDAHILEYSHVIHDYFREIAGPEALERFRAYDKAAEPRRWTGMSPEQRFQRRAGRPQWWASAGGTLDRATAGLPELRRARMDECGIDFSVLYPSAGLGIVNMPNDEFRAPMCRAYNAMVADMFRPHADRMTPVAIIPMHTPDEAVAELDYAVNTLGLKAVKLANFVQRTIPVAEGAPPEIATAASYHDMLALDSPYDYDPVWAKCAALKVTPTAHNTTFSHGFRRSVSNFMYNHCGHFAEGGELFAKALFFGGVLHRFPSLNFAFLEGGVSWGAVMYHGLVHRWQKRNAQKIRQYDPKSLDPQKGAELFDQYAGEVLKSRTGPGDPVVPPYRDAGLSDDQVDDMAYLDEFAACGITRAEDFVDLVAKRFFFGCEADDPYAGIAISGKGMPFGASINAAFGSDIGHWDVEDIRDAVSEAYELVEDGLMDQAQYRRFMFENPARMHAGTNPDFFAGTVVEHDVKEALAGDRSAA